MIKPRGGNIYFIMCTYSYLYDDYDYDTGFYVMMMLHSTTGPLWTTCDKGHIWGDDTFTPLRLYGR